ncbi:MAG: glycosyltransferase [Planctomycetes bacterium]|nr:glycosyltransferase [Planctomycetota bacterium]
MRILFVSRGFPPHGRWGTEAYTLQLARGLVRLGHQVSVFHPDLRDDRPAYGLERLEEGPFRVTRVSLPRVRGKRLETSYEDERLEACFAAFLERERPDLVHFTYLLWTLSVRLPLVAQRLGIPAVLTATDFGLACHRGQCFDWKLADCGGPRPAADCARCIREPSPDEGPRLAVETKRWLARALALCGGFGRVVVTADVERREACVREALGAVAHAFAPTASVVGMLRHAGLAPERITPLVYAVDDAPLLAARPRPAGPETRIAFLGQFAPHKGAHVLLDAVEIMEHRLPESVEPWRVVLHGEGVEGRHRRYPAALAARVQRTNSPRVLLAPPFETGGVARVLAGLSCVVVPSLWRENAPLSALEARAAGIPVIASDVPGLSEIIEPGVHGALFPPGDAAALADLLRAVILGRIPARHAPSQPLSYADHLERVLAVYRRVAASGAPWGGPWGALAAP